ncbi:MAG TPA: peptide chain release factor N(5)-glutamine methyltransferase [Anaerolineales bacterium]|nr:peptide chain release factor N(5)-glutamine methyltransferase [Anaerolineales bacterium]
MPPLFRTLIERASTRLAPLSDSPQLDAQVLLAHVTRQSRTQVLAHAGDQATDAQTAAYESLLGRLVDGEPLPYVIGRQAFFGLEFDLSAAVLIPRPETELLVQTALDWMARSPDRRTVADIGTGSGCIAVSIAVNVPDAHVLASDISLAALNVARENARKYNVADRISFVECDILPPHGPALTSEQHLDLVCANLPYIPTGRLRALPIYGREPSIALDGGPDGLDPFRRFFSLAPDWMAPGGLMLLEIEASSGPAVLSLAYDAFHAAAIHLHRDAAERDRLLEIQLNGIA